MKVLLLVAISLTLASSMISDTPVFVQEIQGAASKPGIWAMTVNTNYLAAVTTNALTLLMKPSSNEPNKTGYQVSDVLKIAPCDKYHMYYTWEHGNDLMFGCINENEYSSTLDMTFFTTENGKLDELATYSHSAQTIYVAQTFDILEHETSYIWFIANETSGDQSSLKLYQTNSSGGVSLYRDLTQAFEYSGEISNLAAIPDNLGITFNLLNQDGDLVRISWFFEEGDPQRLDGFTSFVGPTTDESGFMLGNVENGMWSYSLVWWGFGPHFRVDTTTQGNGFSFNIMDATSFSYVFAIIGDEDLKLYQFQDGVVSTVTLGQGVGAVVPGSIAADEFTNLVYVNQLYCEENNKDWTCYMTNEIAAYKYS